MKCFLIVWWRSQFHRKISAAAYRHYISAAGALLTVKVRKTHPLDIEGLDNDFNIFL
jgi:hypothetical protein